MRRAANEEKPFGELFGDGRAIERYEWADWLLSRRMERSRRDLFTRSRFARDEQRRHHRLAARHRDRLELRHERRPRDDAVTQPEVPLFERPDVAEREEQGASDSDHAARRELLLSLDPRSVDERAVAAAEIGQLPLGAIKRQPRMLARDGLVQKIPVRELDPSQNERPAPDRKEPASRPSPREDRHHARERFDGLQRPPRHRRVAGRPEQASRSDQVRVVVPEHRRNYTAIPRSRDIQRNARFSIHSPRA